MLTTAFKRSLREVEHVFRLSIAEKAFNESLEWSKRPSVSRICKPFPSPPIITSINYKTIHISTPHPPPKKKKPSRYPIFSGLSPFCSLLFVRCTKKSSNKQTNQQHPLRAPPPLLPNTLFFRDGLFTIASPHIATMTLTRLSHLLPWNSKSTIKNKVFTKKKTLSVERGNLNHPKLVTIIVIVFGFQSVY